MISKEKISIYEKEQPELVRLRRLFHQHAEISEMEVETSRMVFDYLTALGLSPRRAARTGVVAMIWAPEEIRDHCETIAVRAELDAVSVRELCDVPWKSKNPGVMHACGHDAIIACGLVLAKLLVEHRQQLKVNVKLLFQPAEENGQGTRMFLEAGLMEHPHVDRFLMFHFANDHEPALEIHRGPSSAAIGSIILTVHGKSAHLANPSSYGIDSIYAASKVVAAIHDINESFVSEVPHVVAIGTMQGGTAKNIVAEQSVLMGTIRSCSLSEYQRLRALCISRIEQIAEETGTRIEIGIDEDPIPPIVNDDEMVDLGLSAGRKIWGEQAKLVTDLYLSGDSAAYYFDYAKGLFMVFTARMENEQNHPLHSGYFNLNEDVLWKAVATMYEFILDLS